jgi:deoxycytidylate deaminase
MNYPHDKLAHIVDVLKKAAIQSTLTHKHGACLLLGNQMITVGVNKRFSVRYQGKTIPLTIHAELDALSNVHPRYLKGMDMVIIRVNKSLQLLNSRPCNACVDKLIQKGIRKVYYSDVNGKIVYEFVDSMPKLHDCSATRMRQCLMN